MMTLLMRQFNTESRYSGSAFGWSISAAICGGTSLLVAETLFTQWSFSAGPGLYISLAATFAFFSFGEIPRLLQFIHGLRGQIRPLNL